MSGVPLPALVLGCRRFDLKVSAIWALASSAAFRGCLPSRVLQKKQYYRRWKILSNGRMKGNIVGTAVVVGKSQLLSTTIIFTVVVVPKATHK